MCHPDDFQAGFHISLPPSQPLPHPSPFFYTLNRITSVQQLFPPSLKPQTAGGGFGCVSWCCPPTTCTDHKQLRTHTSAACLAPPLSSSPSQRMADHEQNNLDPDNEEEEEEENEGPRGARRRRGAEVPLDALLRLLAGQRVVVRGREAAGGNDELISGLKRSGMLSRCASD